MKIQPVRISKVRVQRQKVVPNERGCQHIKELLNVECGKKKDHLRKLFYFVRSRKFLTSRRLIFFSFRKRRTITKKSPKKSSVPNRALAAGKLGLLVPKQYAHMRPKTS